MAERRGFEPLVRCYPYDGLANRCFRPLSHLSALNNSMTFNIYLFDTLSIEKSVFLRYFFKKMQIYQHHKQEIRFFTQKQVLIQFPRRTAGYFFSIYFFTAETTSLPSRAERAASASCSASRMEIFLIRRRV